MDKILFDKYWKNYSDSIESLLIRKIGATAINVSSINDELSTFSKKWQDKRLVEGTWIGEVAEDNPQKAEKILKKITDFKLQEEKFSIPSMFKYYLYPTLIGIISIIVVLFLSLSFWKTILIPVLCFMLSFGFIIPQGSSKIEQVRKELVFIYLKQLANLKKELDNIILE